MKAKVKIIYLVWACRGSYSDRNEYAVCWFLSEEEAKAHAEKLQKLSEEWNTKFFKTDWNKVGWEQRGPMQEEAMKAIGDDEWSPNDDTTYSTYKLERGPSA